MIRNNCSKTVEELIEQGDVLGTLEAISHEYDHMNAGDMAAAISRSINVKARLDPSGLTSDAFTSIIRQATTLFARVQLHIDRELRSADLTGGCEGLPRNIIENGWIERAERLAKFIADMAALQARVTHLSKLEDKDVAGKTANTGRRRRSTEGGPRHRKATASSETSPRGRRLRDPHQTIGTIDEIRRAVQAAG